MKNRKIVLEDGSVFYGEAFGSKATKVVRLSVNKQVFDYETVINETTGGTVFTYPLIGNYGIETLNPKAEAIIVREICEKPNHALQKMTLAQACTEYNIIGISQIDTRALAKKLYNKPQSALICDLTVNDEEAKRMLQEK